MPQMTVLVTTIASFLCPSDGNPGSSGTFFVAGEYRRVGASNYACNIGLNRRIDGGRPDSTWKLNGPNYVASRWDTSVNQATDLTTFLDGTSNTAIFSEWIKGEAVPTGTSRNGLLEVYNLGENSELLPDGSAIHAALQHRADHQLQPAMAVERRVVGFRRHHDLLAHPDAQPDCLRLPRSQSGSLGAPSP